MVAFNFKKQFSADVEAGRKVQTIRQRMRAKPGDALQLYTGMRSPSCRKLRDAICLVVDSVTITPSGPFFGHPELWPKDKNVFAESDGFATYADMYQWFCDTYGEEIFNGYITRWAI